MASGCCRVEAGEAGGRAPLAGRLETWGMRHFMRRGAATGNDCRGRRPSEIHPVPEAIGAVPCHCVSAGHLTAGPRSREDLPTGLRITAVQRGARQTVGMGHHPEAALVYAGNTSWK